MFESALLLGRKPATEKKVDRGVELIEDMLEMNDGRVEVKSVEGEAAKQGISKETLRRARRIVGPKTERIDGVYHWVDAQQIQVGQTEIGN